MSKEYIEALRTIKIKCHPNSNPSPLVDDAIDVVEKAIMRLESIDNTNTSEALNCLESGKKVMWAYDYDTIKQALLKAQEQEKVLSILKEKRVDLPYLRCCLEDNQSVERYNEYIRNKTMDYDHEEELTQEEFDLLKRWLG